MHFRMYKCMLDDDTYDIVRLCIRLISENIYNLNRLFTFSV
jgi:hypothetical protein